MQQPLILSALLLTAFSMGGVAVNEYSHGGVADMMGFGHRHMFDGVGDHCPVYMAHQTGMHGEGGMSERCQDYRQNETREATLSNMNPRGGGVPG